MAEETVLFHREEENVSLVANSEVSHRYNINEDDETESASEFQTVELDESEAEEKERDGVYEYENALRYIGFGPFHLLILLGTARTVDLVLVVAFYCGVVRLLETLEVDVEPDYQPWLDIFPLD